MKIRKLTEILTGPITFINSILILLGLLGKMKGYFIMFTTLPYIFGSILAMFLVIWVFNYNTRKDIGERLDKFNKTLQDLDAQIQKSTQSLNENVMGYKDATISAIEKSNH